MKIQLHDGLPFVTVTLIHQGQPLILRRVLLDTGSAGSVFSADELLKIKYQQAASRSQAYRPGARQY